MTTTYMLTREQFIIVRSCFLKLSQERRLVSSDIVFYNLVRGLPLDRGFTPTTNPTKLINGLSPTHGFKHALSYLTGLCKYNKDLLRDRCGPLLSDEVITTMLTRL